MYPNPYMVSGMYGYPYPHGVPQQFEGYRYESGETGSRERSRDKSQSKSVSSSKGSKKTN